MSAKKRLKRGLDHFLSQPVSDVDIVDVVPVVPETESTQHAGALLTLPCNAIQPGKYQPRQEMDLKALEDLASSIRAQGLIQPVTVRSIGNNAYELIAGERRWRAAQIAGLETIPAIVKRVDDPQTMALALIENIQREDLNPIEEAMALQRLMDECEYTHQQVADAVGKPRTSISNLLRLLALTPEVKQMVSDGALTLGHAKVLLVLEDNDQITAAREVTNKALSVRETEALVQNIQNPAEQLVSQVKKVDDPDVIALEKRLSELLTARVNIKHSPQGKGKLVIKYNNLAELDEILSHMQ